MAAAPGGPMHAGKVPRLRIRGNGLRPHPEKASVWHWLGNSGPYERRRALTACGGCSGALRPRSHGGGCRAGACSERPAQALLGINGRPHAVARGTTAAVSFIVGVHTCICTASVIKKTPSRPTNPLPPLHPPTSLFRRVAILDQGLHVVRPVLARPCLIAYHRTC